MTSLSDAIAAKNYDSTNTRPGYSSTRTKYAFMQSRRVFRYQPGRISGFTFGLRSSTEPVTGATLEWGISNPTDQYVFRICLLYTSPSQRDRQKCRMPYSY